MSSSSAAFFALWWWFGSWSGVRARASGPRAGSYRAVTAVFGRGAERCGPRSCLGFFAGPYRTSHGSPDPGRWPRNGIFDSASRPCQTAPRCLPNTWDAEAFIRLAAREHPFVECYEQFDTSREATASHRDFSAGLRNGRHEFPTHQSGRAFRQSMPKVALLVFAVGRVRLPVGQPRCRQCGPVAPMALCENARLLGIASGRSRDRTRGQRRQE